MRRIIVWCKDLITLMKVLSVVVMLMVLKIDNYATIQ